MSVQFPASTYNSFTYATVEPKGVWMAYRKGWTQFHPFGSEITALRFAVLNKMDVMFLEWGDVIVTDAADMNISNMNDKKKAK